jgi:TolA-binding protein
VALCWGYSLSEEPATAVDPCRQAAEAGDAGSLENLAVALARSGQFAHARDALAQFRDTSEGQAKAAEVDAWLAALAAGQNPFDAATLRRLREE